MRFILVLVFFFVSCSETKSTERDLGTDMNSDVLAVDFGPDKSVDLKSKDVLAKDMSPDKTSESDASVDLADANLQDMSPILSNAIAVTGVSLFLDESEATTPIGVSDNALPFLSVSFHLGDPVLRFLHLDASIENGVLQVSRFGDPLTLDESMTISGNVVAFDPARVRVQCKAFQTGTEVVSVAIDPVPIENSFVNFWSKIATGSNNKDVAFISARFNSDSEILLERLSPAGTINGHLCVTESLGDTFSVQHVVSKIPPGELEVLVPIETIDLSRSIVFVSHQATRMESKPGFAQVACELQSSAVRCLRGLNEDEISDLRIQVVTFKDRTTVSRFHVVMEDGVKESRLDLPGVKSKNSVIFGPVGVLGEVATDGNDKPFVPSSHVEAVIENNAILFKRGDPWVGRLEFFPQVVSW